MKAILGRIVNLSEQEAQCVLSNTLDEFRHRHHDIESLFGRRYQDLKPLLPPRLNVSTTMQMLIGAYFMSEYALEAAALFNPSIVPHPDQNGIPQGSLRFIMSLRATGEGHISSIEFRSGVIGPDGNVTLDPYERFVSSPHLRSEPMCDKREFLLKLRDENHLNPTTKEMLGALPDTFSKSDLLKSVSRIRKKYKKLSAARNESIGYAEALSEMNCEMSFKESVPLSERVVFPVSSFESNGIEDARFVRFVDGKGIVQYYATYTAYNGRQIMPMLLETSDFCDFRVRSMSGKAAKNKGMALFPRKVNGRYVMISRQDGESLYCVTSEDIFSWRKPGTLLKPTFPWEFTQIGNCGSPVETERGWILLTHGVGPVRKYCIGAVLLDLENPSKVVGRLEEPLIAPQEDEREGYVPNVVYTCGAIAHSGKLIIPYAMSDQSTRFASVEISDLIGKMK
jgi:predicted GH43/DUF377 family glycosyl hydrolase